MNYLNPVCFIKCFIWYFIKWFQRSYLIWASQKTSVIMLILLVRIMIPRGLSVSHSGSPSWSETELSMALALLILFFFTQLSPCLDLSEFVFFNNHSFYVFQIHFYPTYSLISHVLIVKCVWCALMLVWLLFVFLTYAFFISPHFFLKGAVGT